MTAGHFKPQFMTRSNLYIILSDGRSFDCVAESSSAPEQGYFVETLLIPLLNLKNTEKEINLLTEHCTLGELRTNASYRYHLNLQKGEFSFHEEVYNFQFDTFKKGRNLTGRVIAYLDKIQNAPIKALKRNRE
ncbi:MAG: penicillin-binding protein [Mucilaginibacter sp.]|nr:penicillin-binding protein [Mucilaginibacter sp.]